MFVQYVSGEAVHDFMLMRYWHKNRCELEQCFTGEWGQHQHTVSIKYRYSMLVVLASFYGPMSTSVYWYGIWILSMHRTSVCLHFIDYRLYKVTHLSLKLDGTWCRYLVALEAKGWTSSRWSCEPVGSHYQYLLSKCLCPIKARHWLG